MEKDIDANIDKIREDGLNCILKYHTQCESLCLDQTKTPERCYGCLSNVNSCQSIDPDTGVRSQTDSCCPLVKVASECLRCINKTGGKYTGKDCHDTAPGVSHTTLYIILGVVGGVIVIAVIVGIAVYKAKNKGESEARLMAMTGGDSAVSDAISQLGQRGNIDESVFNDVERRLANR